MVKDLILYNRVMAGCSEITATCHRTSRLTRDDSVYSRSLGRPFQFTPYPLLAMLCLPRFVHLKSFCIMRLQLNNTVICAQISAAPTETSGVTYMD